MNVFKLCGLDQMHNATKEGDVTTVVDRGIARKAGAYTRSTFRLNVSTFCGIRWVHDYPPVY